MNKNRPWPRKLSTVEMPMRFTTLISIHCETCELSEEEIGEQQQRWSVLYLFVMEKLTEPKHARNHQTVKLAKNQRRRRRKGKKDAKTT